MADQKEEKVEVPLIRTIWSWNALAPGDKKLQVVPTGAGNGHKPGLVVPLAHGEVEQLLKTGTWNGQELSESDIKFLQQGFNASPYKPPTPSSDPT